MSAVTEELKERREECAAACGGLWVNQGDCDEKMKGMKPPTGFWLEVVKIAIILIPILVSVIYGYGRLNATVTHNEANQGKRMDKLEGDISYLTRLHIYAEKERQDSVDINIENRRNGR